jgi:sialate O-acetylesterase
MDLAYAQRKTKWKSSWNGARGNCVKSSIAIYTLLFSTICFAQTVAVPRASGSVPGFNAKQRTQTENEQATVGDAPDAPGPLATDLSLAIDPASIHRAMRKVADWQIATGEARFNRLWTFATLYDGLLATSESTGDPKYKDAVLRMAERNQWQLIDTRFPHADDEALGRAYLALYHDHPAPERIDAVRATMDRLIARPDDPREKLWSWCDALFMAPPVLADLAKITASPKYLDYMNREWWITSKALYDPAEHLFFRDKSYITRNEANGQKLFWARGNGWVFASLAYLLETMPPDHPDRPKYVTQFQQMAQRIASLQQSDGLWRSGLLDPGAYPQPEISSSAFFTYGLAWGINHGLLDRKQYFPQAAKAWKGMIEHIYADGRLGSIQSIDAAPGAVKPSGSYVYGVGAFLLAGSELSKMHAEVVLPCLFQDHMVLQEGTQVPVWGTAAGGERITVTLARLTETTEADANGHWQVFFNLKGLAGGPYKLSVQGANRIVLTDVLVGEVWLASGQSNMELPLWNTENGKEESAHSDNSQLRQFKVVQGASVLPESACKGRWIIAEPESSGNFTAVGYYFAKCLQQYLHRPVALIGSYYGGSNIESWLSAEAIETLPIKSAADKIIEEAKSYAERQNIYQDNYKAWQAKYQRQDVPMKQRNRYAAYKGSAMDWHTIEINGSYTADDLPNGGVLWLSRVVHVNTDMAGVYLALHLGTMHEFDEVFWNGVRIGSTTAEATTAQNEEAHSSTARRYDVPANLVKEGDATISIRIFNPAGAPSISGLSLSKSGYLVLSGEWQRRTESSEPVLTADAKTSFPQRPGFMGAERYRPSALFNAMINPLLPYNVRGVIWFQGESNTSRSVQYRTLFPALIKDWRAQWRNPKMPFYFCQLANYKAKNATPEESGLAELREAQSMALELPQTGQALTIDIGEEADIHFRDKKTVGLRLLRIALAKTYGLNVSYSGPVYDSIIREGNSMRIHFQFTDGGLRATEVPATYKRTSTLTTLTPLVKNSPNSQLQGFQICGQDRKWVWANANIDGLTVVVSSPEVSDPVAVRYAWGDNPTVNLYNGAGLPAAPFRTDNFPEITRSAQFE